MFKIKKINTQHYTYIQSALQFALQLYVCFILLVGMSKDVYTDCVVLYYNGIPKACRHLNPYQLALRYFLLAICSFM